MTTQLQTEIVPGELAQIVEAVFLAMMDLEVATTGAPWAAAKDRVASAICLSGEWNGTILLECSVRQACGFTGRFVSMEPPEELDDLVRDCLGELANMIGGNLKCVLRSGINLCMPFVIDGGDYRLRAGAQEIEQRLAFECGEGPFWVTVLTNSQQRGADRHSVAIDKIAGW